jgi:hypothetical protein
LSSASSPQPAQREDEVGRSVDRIAVRAAAAHVRRLPTDLEMVGQAPTMACVGDESRLKADGTRQARPRCVVEQERKRAVAADPS